MGRPPSRADQDETRRELAEANPSLAVLGKLNAGEMTGCWNDKFVEGERLWVGEFPRVDQHSAVVDEVRNLFRGFMV